jgi:hypothetical protein
MDKLLKSYRAVKRFTARPLMLPAFVKEGHDNGNTPCFSAYSGNQTLEILVMIIGGHVVFVAAERICKTVVADINKKIEVGASDRFVNGSLSFAGPEPRYLGIEDIGVALVAFKGKGGMMLVLPFGPPFYKVLIDLMPHIHKAFKGNDPKRTNRYGFQVTLFLASWHVLPPD